MLIGENNTKDIHMAVDIPVEKAISESRYYGGIQDYQHFYHIKFSKKCG